jgi:hypothetical protein
MYEFHPVERQPKSASRHNNRENRRIVEAYIPGRDSCMEIGPG